MKKDVLDRRSAAWLTTIALSLTSLASASQEKPFDFDDILLPTDLVAAVVNVEDDIVSSYLTNGSDATAYTEVYTSNAEVGSTATRILGTDVASLVDEQKAEQQTAVEPVKTASGSIFDNVVDGPELVEVKEPEVEAEVSIAEQGRTVH